MAGLQPAVILALARDNDAAMIREVVTKQGFPVDYANKIGQTALHIAALHGNLDAAAALLQLGAPAGARNAHGATPLHFAANAHREPLRICNLLLEAGADPDVQDSRGALPYELAEDDEVRALLGGPDPHLFDCAAKGDVAGLRALFTEDPDHPADCLDGQGQAPIHLAAAGGHLGAVAFLLQHGSRVDFQNPQGDTALHCAVREGHAPVALLLLRQGAKPDVQNFNTSEYAAGNWSSHGHVLAPLHQTPLHLATEAGDGGLVRVLLAAGAAVDVADFDGATALHLAVEAGDEELAGLLAEAGADVNRGSKDAASPLHLAAARGAASMVRLLLSKGAAPNAADTEGWTPLMLAARGPSRGAAAVEALLAAGADPLASNTAGSTPLHLAAANGRGALADALLAAAPAAAAKRDASGATPADRAKGPELAARLRAAAGG